MKNFLSAAFAAAVLLVAPSAFAAPLANQEGPRRPPVAQGPAYYGDRNYGGGYDRGPRPDYQAPDCRVAAPRPAPDRYDQGPRYGYEPAPPAYPPPQRRPVAVAIQIHL
ncbi:MAG: hypothetical protein ACRYFR_20470 [Janthinobacterium lividum]